MVGGKGEFIGGALTTATPEDNKTVFKQGIETQDIINHSRYEGNSISAGVSIGNTTGKPQAGMNGMGYASDGNDQTSTTFAGVTGVAGKSEATTGTRDILNESLANSFDAQKVTEELNAQVQITKEFGKEAPKAVGDFAKTKTQPYETAVIYEQTLQNALAQTTDPKQRQLIEQELQKVQTYKQAHEQDYHNWKEGGAYRVAAHTALVALGTGSVEGALTTGGVAAAAPVISDLEQKMSDQLVEQGMSADIAQSTANAITSVAIVGAGTGAGLDASSTGMAANVDANNRQLHPQEQQLAKVLYEKAKKEGWKRADGKAYTLKEIEDALRWANSTKYKEKYNQGVTVIVGNKASSTAIDKVMYDHGLGADFKSGLWKQTESNINTTTFTQNFDNIKKPDTNLVNFIKGETKSYGYSWVGDVPQPYNAKTAGPTPKPKPTTTAQIIPQRSLDNKNQAIINNNGSIDSGSLPAAQQQANQKTFDAAVMVVDAVGLATGAGEVVIAVKWAGKKTIQYVVKKSALDAAKQGTTSVDDLIKVSKPYTGSISNSQRGSTGIAKPNVSVNNSSISDVSDQIIKAERIGSGLKEDVGHRSASMVSKSQLEQGKVFEITGNDGIKRNLLQTNGELDGKNGIFEYIIDPAGSVTHQRFIEGGVINGIPNQKVPKK